MTLNGEQLENHMLCQATIFGIEQFPSEIIYIASTQKCFYSIFLKKKKQRYMYLGFQMTRHSFHPSSGLLSIDVVPSFTSLLPELLGLRRRFVAASVPWRNNFAIFNP